MECPNCRKQMKLERHYETRDDHNNRRYDHKTYLCEKDDIWITIENPIIS